MTIILTKFWWNEWKTTDKNKTVNGNYTNHWLINMHVYQTAPNMIHCSFKVLISLTNYSFIIQILWCLSWCHTKWSLMRRIQTNKTQTQFCACIKIQTKIADNCYNMSWFLLFFHSPLSVFVFTVSLSLIFIVTIFKFILKKATGSGEKMEGCKSITKWSHQFYSIYIVHRSTKSLPSYHNTYNLFSPLQDSHRPVSYKHLRAHETVV